MSGLDYAQLAIYGPLSVLVLYLAYRHGWRGITGWLYLFIFCTLRVVGPAMSIIADKNHTSHSTAALITSIGLSPILLAAVGILHEARKYRNPKVNTFWEWITVIVLHLLVGQGIGMLAAASSAFSGGPVLSASKFLIKFGVATLEVVWLIIIIWAIISVLPSQTMENAPGHQGGTRLLHSIFFALPFLGIRVTYTMIVIFTDMKKLAAAPLGMKVGLNFIPELIVVIGFVAVGMWTKDIGLAKAEEREMISTTRYTRPVRSGGSGLGLKERIRLGQVTVDSPKNVRG